MQDERNTQKERTETSDFGAAIITGGILLLAIYGGYKLYQMETNQTPQLGSGVESEILNKIIDQELKS